LDKLAFNEAEFARAAHLLDLSYQQSLASCPKGPGVLAYLTTRPAAEQRLALADAAVVARAARMVSADLFLVFPSLAQRAVLARAVDDNPGLLRLLLAGSDAARVVELIAVEPAARPAGEAIEQDPSVVRLLPAYDQLSAAGKAFVDRLRKASDADDEVVTEASRVHDLDGDERITEATTERDPDEKRAVERAQAMKELDAITSLPEAIDALVAGDLRREPSSIVALLASHRAQVPTLLTEPTHWSRVAQLARRLYVPPHVACPFLSIDLLLQMPNALRWYFELDDRNVLLGAAARPGAANLLAQHLAADVPGARDWLKGLPRGAALTDDERRSLDRIEAATGNADVIRQLFVTRFDVAPPLVAVPGEKVDEQRGVGYDAGDLDSLYRIASRLPASHLDQKRIQRIAAQDTPDALGSWDGGTVKIDPSIHEGLADETFHPDTHADDADGGWLTTDEVKREFGYDDARIAAQVAAKNLSTKEVDGLMLYKMKPAKIDMFTQIALHEIGHSVDSMLGGHTVVVFDHAGWHEFNDTGFETWAAEMGGWDRVSAADKVKIREAWIDATREGKGVHQLVSRDHPALHERNAGVPIVDSAREGKSFQRDERVAHNGRVFVAGSYPGTWYSLKAEVVPSAPSYFSLHAPQEYFAESYVEYYRKVDGSPGSEANKGGGLAAPVKQFFDQHVDTLKYDPRRFESPES
ncbi:MAG TPA: hypothetical protein VK601_14125, partial [Kofleriaceae bacterium]|nr:hypothetical protein [Kofleriaceae bacterium]